MQTIGKHIIYCFVFVCWRSMAEPWCVLNAPFANHIPGVQIPSFCFALLCFCSFDFLCCCNIKWNNSWCSVWHADCFCSWPLFTVYRCATLSTEILLWQMVKWVRWTTRIDFMSILEISINYTLVKMNIIAWLQRQSQSIAHRRNSGMREKNAQQMIMSIVAGQNGKNIVAIVMPNGNGHSMFAFFPGVFRCSADSVFARHCNCHGKAI